MKGWEENEIRETIKAYFSLLEKEKKQEPVNKRQLYRELSEKFPARTEKAFELKFQNISAILYEEHLPFCSGLKPKPNYQRLLKILVLDFLDRNPLPVQSPKDILIQKLQSLHDTGYLPIVGEGSGRFGLTIEKYLGIPPNSDKNADFMGIELKTKHDASLQTLFSRTPSNYLNSNGKADFFEKHSYWDEKRQRRALYTSFSCYPDSLGFSLKASNNKILIQRAGVDLLEYEAERIEEALLSKHSQTAFINLSVQPGKRGQECRVDSALYCKWPSVIRFMQLIPTGHIYLDFTMSLANGKVRDHGFLWRIKSDSLPDLYLDTERVDFR